MIFERMHTILGIIKMFIYKMIYFRRIKAPLIIKIYNNFKIYTRNKSVIKIGNNFRARNNLILRCENNAKIEIGDGCFFNDNCSINSRKQISIGNKVLFGPNVQLFDHDHDYKNDISKFICKEIKIGDNVWIGANSIILKGAIIGNNVVIGAGSIVNKKVEDNTVYYQKKEDKYIERDKNEQ